MQKKSIFLVIICLFLGAGLSQLSAQNNGVYVDWMRSYDESVKVYCDGEVVDIIDCTLDIHQVRKWEKFLPGIDPDLIWRRYSVKGQSVSRDTGELFKYKEASKSDYVKSGATMRYHLIGNKGTKYIGFLTIDWNPLVITPSHMVCH